MLNKKDFVEIEFTGRIKDGEIFDSNIKEDLEKINPDSQTKPFIFCLGEDMFLKSVDDFLIGKDAGEYKIELGPEKAFGRRDAKLIQMIPMKIFIEQKLNPVPGAVFNFDNRIAKVLTVSGGRVLVDFNNPIAGKDVVYNIKVLRKLTDLNEKIKSLVEFLFRKDFKFELKEKKLILNVDKGFKQFAELFKDKFKEMLGLELEVQEVEKGREKEEKPKKKVKK